MNYHEFDIFARHLGIATSRRSFARLGSGALAALGFSSSEVFAAKSGKCKNPCGECELCDSGKCRKTKHGKKRCKRGTCKPKADFTNCEFGFCFEGECTPT